RFAEIRLFRPFSTRVWLMTDGRAMVAIDAHGAVAVIAMEGTTWLVHRNLMVIHAQAITLRIAIREKARLQHAIGREADAGHHIGRGEGRLFDFSKEIIWISIQLQHADFD